MAIWFRDDISLDEINAMRSNTMLEVLGITFTAIGEDSLEGTMPVDDRTVQPFRILHGGANVALAETLGSLASWLCLDPDRFYCVGVEINANHLRAMREGMVTGVARPIHLGRSTHVWEVRIRDEQERPVCVSRMTMAVLEKRT
ncbi:MAG: hotdog fold thioesterase [Candidatus Hydrogenedentes bacterium]|nr:hotdog fold thioesterase [Candidatus Hydrogenedentota bacterium]